MPKLFYFYIYVYIYLYIKIFSFLSCHAPLCKISLFYMDIMRGVMIASRPGALVNFLNGPYFIRLKKRRGSGRDKNAWRPHAPGLLSRG